MDRRARCGGVCFALILASACKFEPPLASAGAGDAAVSDASRADTGTNDGSTIDGGETPDGSVPDATPNEDATTPPSTVYLPAAGGGHLSGAQHQASMIGGGSAAWLTATSTGHRVQFGGGPR